MPTKKERRGQPKEKLAEWGKKTRFSGKIAARENQKKSVEKRKANKIEKEEALKRLTPELFLDAIEGGIRRGEVRFVELGLKITEQMPSDKVESLVINAPDTDLSKIKEIRKLLQDDK